MFQQLLESEPTSQLKQLLESKTTFLVFLSPDPAIFTTRTPALGKRALPGSATWGDRKPVARARQSPQLPICQVPEGAEEEGRRGPEPVRRASVSVSVETRRSD